MTLRRCRRKFWCRVGKIDDTRVRWLAGSRFRWGGVDGHGRRRDGSMRDQGTGLGKWPFCRRQGR